MNKSMQRARDIFLVNSSTMITSDAIEAGIHPVTLYRMRKEGIIIPVSRGLNRLADQPEPKYPDLMVVSKIIPHGVICLISALSFHEITTEIPHQVDIAIKRGIRPRKIDHPPVKYRHFAPIAYASGIETHTLDGIPIKVYSAEKTLVDCFKFRYKIGFDVALEALKLYRERKTVNVPKIMEYARVCRVSNIIRPYLETVL